MRFSRMSFAGLRFLLGISCFLSAQACGSADTMGGRSRAGSSGAVGISGVGGAGATSGTIGDFGNPNGQGGTMPFIPPPPVGGGGPCVNLQCQQMECSTGATTVSGKVFDPAGVNPLYNVVVYVPNEAVLPLPSGASCDACDSLYTGSPIAVALTDATGSFVLQNAPIGTDIPLVVQVGKWRRQFTIPSIAECQDNPQPDGMLRLPRNRMEGDIPNIAISTGSADTLECLLRRVGLDASEYVPGNAEGRVHIFQGNPFLFFGPAPNTTPVAPPSATALWNSLENLMPYDIVLLSCEGQETIGMNQQALHDYANAGGRVFASHFHYSWFNTGPYSTENLATWLPGGNDIGDVAGEIVTTLSNGQPFPKGQALHDWLGNVGALQNGTLPIAAARHNADVSPMNTPSQSWILAGPGSEAPGATQYFSFNTPTDAVQTPDGPSAYCGRVVFSDLHVGAASGDLPSQAVPGGCAAVPLSPQEAALEFMLFDLSSCVTPDEAPPIPPVLVVE